LITYDRLLRRISRRRFAAVNRTLEVLFGRLQVVPLGDFRRLVDPARRRARQGDPALKNGGQRSGYSHSTVTLGSLGKQMLENIVELLYKLAPKLGPCQRAIRAAPFH
jgi:hypothetical protein